MGSYLMKEHIDECKTFNFDEFSYDIVKDYDKDNKKLIITNNIEKCIIDLCLITQVGLNPNKINRIEFVEQVDENRFIRTIVKFTDTLQNRCVARNMFRDLILKARS